MTESSFKETYPLVEKLLKPLCKRVELSGSARRQAWGMDNRGKFDSGTIHVLAIADNQKLHAIQDIAHNKWNSDFPAKTTEIGIFCTPVLVHWISEAQWGLAQFQLTGPSQYVNAAQRHWNGRFKHHRLEEHVEGVGHVRVSTPEEKNVFKKLGIKYQPPTKRIKFDLSN